jgi:rubrerythrin
MLIAKYMDLGPKTKKNLEEAFAGESMARNKYSYFSSVAKKAGLVQIANVFEETANNEKEHAKLWARELGLIGITEENLKAAIEGEHFENTEMYVRMAKEAKEEGHLEIAKQFELVAKVEVAHETRYGKLLANLKEGKTFSRNQVTKWKCSNCGYIHEGESAPDVCPACKHAQGYFELFCESY